MAENGNNRTHEPSLRELTAELDGFKDFVTARLDGLEKLLDERDRRYKDGLESRDKAVEAAFDAQKELFNTVQASSKEAVAKAESAQRDYNERSNEFRGALDDSNRDKISRPEFASSIKTTIDKMEDKDSSLDGKIEEVKAQVADLRESRSAGGGRQEQSRESRGNTNWLIALIVSAGIAIAGTMIAAALAISSLAVNLLK